MGKRSNFKRFKQDNYDTPPEAVLPLMPFLLDGTTFIEPCAGRGYLINSLEKHGHECMYGSDITPGRDDIYTKDVFDLTGCDANCFITNPPWTRPILHRLILHLSRFAPTWLLLDADWMHTKQAVPYLARCRKIVSIGRMKWIAGSKYTGKDNCCWYLFGKRKINTNFYGR